MKKKKRRKRKRRRRTGEEKENKHSSFINCPNQLTSSLEHFLGNEADIYYTRKNGISCGLKGTVVIQALRESLL